MMLMNHVYEQSTRKMCGQLPMASNKRALWSDRAMRPITDTRVWADIICLIRKRTGQEVKCEQGWLDNLSQL